MMTQANTRAIACSRDRKAVARWENQCIPLEARNEQPQRISIDEIEVVPDRASREVAYFVYARGRIIGRYHQSRINGRWLVRGSGGNELRLCDTPEQAQQALVDEWNRTH